MDQPRIQKLRPFSPGTRALIWAAGISASWVLVGAIAYAGYRLFS